MTATVGCKLKQNANEGCSSYASLAGLVLCFIACFILLVIAPLTLNKIRLYMFTSTEVVMFLPRLVDLSVNRISLLHSKSKNVAATKNLVAKLSKN